ncbi:MAG TPA: DUF3034 family protein [Steroidobacteraceae bacterium]
MGLAHLGRSAIVLASLGLAIAAVPAIAGDRLEWTGAVAQVEGSAGGGLVPWALIGGLGTDEQLGASGFLTHASMRDFSLRAAGVSVSSDNRVEISFARQRFDAGSVVPGLTLGQDITAIKIRLLGDAVFAPDQLLPQIAAGAQWKQTLDFDQVPRAVGAARGEDVDLYIAATKVYFAVLDGRNIILDATLRRTRANQFGLLGFGGNGSSYRFVPECSAAVFLNDDILLGAEYRDKPNNLAAFRENSAQDAFLAWAPSKNVTITGAWSELGRIAGKPAQRGVYVSLWLGI